MKAVWKFPIPIKDAFTLTIPEGAKLLHVEQQCHGDPDDRALMLWALVDTGAPRTQRDFRLFGTGREIGGAEAPQLTYVGTALLFEGQRVYHLFELVCRASTS